MPVSLRSIARSSILSALSLAAAGLPAAEPSRESQYHVLARYPIGGTDTGYDYLTVDPGTRRVFVAHGTRVEVLAADGGTRLGQIEGLAGVHGIEVDTALGRGFATSGEERAVVMFDPRTLKVQKRIRYTGVKPDAMRLDPASWLLFVVNGGSTGDVTVINPQTAAIVATIDLKGGKLEQIAFDGRGRGYVNDEHRNVVHVLDTKSLEEVAVWPLAPCEEPTGMAIDRAGHRIFAACGNNVAAAVDTESGKVVGTAPIGADPDGAVYDPQGRRVLVSNRDGTLSVLSEDAAGQLHPEQTVKSGPGARTIALDEKTGRVFLPFAEQGPAPEAAAGTKQRAPMLPASFGVLVIGK